jgi:HAD superfamily hydrolase (TIGR01459 family)
MNLLDLPGNYRLVLCDIWGCVHDGVTIFPAAEALLREWRRQGRIILLITNAPRPAMAVRAQLGRLGLDPECYDEVITSGDTGLEALRVQGRRRAGFIGTADDRQALSGSGIELAAGPDGDVVICTGLPEDSQKASDHEIMLQDMKARGARLLCFNPDRIVLRGSVAEPCAGAIAELYAEMGGAVDYFGKPYAPIYDRALEMASGIADRSFERDEVVAVGDSLATDFVGAADAGFAFVFITHGIEGERISTDGIEAVIVRFSTERGIALPQPLAVASHLG